MHLRYYSLPGYEAIWAICTWRWGRWVNFASNLHDMVLVKFRYDMIYHFILYLFFVGAFFNLDLWKAFFSLLLFFFKSYNEGEHDIVKIMNLYIITYMYSLVSLLSGIYPFHTMHSLLVTIISYWLSPKVHYFNDSLNHVWKHCLCFALCWQ